jgi:hypothetical protein
METPIYTVVESGDNRRVELVELGPPLLPFAAWQQLAERIAQEKCLTPYPAAVLARRWKQGQALAAVKEGEIVGYTSFEPVYDEAARERLSQALKLEAQCLPNIVMVEFTSGWTHPAWRRKQISLQLRRRLLQAFDAPNYLPVGITIGLGASPILARLGWQIVAWPDIAFASSLLAVPSSSIATADQEATWPLPEGVALYQGPPIVFGSEVDHPWQNFCHFWVSKLALMIEMNRQLADLLAGDLIRWRRAVVEAARPLNQLGWKLIVFNEQIEVVQSS